MRNKNTFMSRKKQYGSHPRKTNRKPMRFHWSWNVRALIWNKDKRKSS